MLAVVLAAFVFASAGLADGFMNVIIMVAGDLSISWLQELAAQVVIK